MSEAPRPWLECVDLHPDVLSEELSEDVFALDLGALADHLIGTDSGLPANAEAMCAWRIDGPLPMKFSARPRRNLHRPASDPLMPNSPEGGVLGSACPFGTRASRPLCHMTGLRPGPPVRACGRDARAPRFATGARFRLRRVGRPAKRTW